MGLAGGRFLTPIAAPGRGGPAARCQIGVLIAQSALQNNPCARWAFWAQSKGLAPPWFRSSHSWFWPKPGAPPRLFCASVAVTSLKPLLLMLVFAYSLLY